MASIVRNPAFFAALLGTNRMSSARNCTSVPLPAISRLRFTGISVRLGAPGTDLIIRALDPDAVDCKPSARERTWSAENDSFSVIGYPPGFNTEPTTYTTPAFGTDMVSP